MASVPRVRGLGAEVWAVQSSWKGAKMSRCASITAALGAVCLSYSTSTVALAQQAVPAASIFSEPTIGAGVDKLESSVKDTINYDRQIGDYLIWRAGETA